MLSVNLRATMGLTELCLQSKIPYLRTLSKNAFLGDRELLGQVLYLIECLYGNQIHFRVILFLEQIETGCS